MKKAERGLAVESAGSILHVPSGTDPI